MKRTNEPAFLMLFFITALAAAGVWLWTEVVHHRESLLVDQVLSGKTPDTDALAEVFSSNMESRKDILPGRYLFFPGILAVAAADIPDLPEAVRLHWLKLARQGLPAALMREPANSRAWLYLAYTTWLFDGPGPSVNDALRMSIYTAPADSQILLWRLKLAILNKNFQDGNFNDLLLRQIQLAWCLAPKSLARIAESYGIETLVRQALSTDPEELARFEGMMGN